LAPNIRDVEVAAVLRDLSDDIRNAELLPPSTASQGGDAWSAFMNRWVRLAVPTVEIF
jgi:hypothetical protein